MWRPGLVFTFNEQEDVMLKQLWMSGILGAFLVFGVKIGVGLGARVNHPSIPTTKKWTFAGGAILAYMLLFFCMYALVTGCNLFNYLDRIAKAVQYGMAVHVALASGLFAWGVVLLGVQQGRGHTALGPGILLVLPCPVCATVILLNLSLAFSIFPMSPAVTTLVLFACFTACILLTLAMVTLCRHHITSMDNFLGLSMVLIALYFALTVLVAPIYPEIKAAYQMAKSNTPVGQLETTPFLILAGSAVVLGISGFYRSYFYKA
jgi:predicted transporter